MSEIRCRIAPSPSGFLHIGTAKTALFNWLFALKEGGVFILRLEDTDAERTDEAYVEGMCEGFRWLGIDWDEGPAFGGEPERGAYGPYRQSQRRDIHRAEIQRLLDSGHAYKCFCTKEELAEERTRAEAEKRPLAYSGKCRHLASAEIAARQGQSFVVRFRVPEGYTEVHDLVQGTVRTENKEFDDFVIQKPNGDPIFHIAVVVDDGLMKITHVIRGDDHLTNAPRHVMLFNALGYPLPQFAHLPMVLDEQGKKFSKRLKGANVLDWRDEGYLPESLINYVALLGWTPEESNRELFSREELIRAFTIKRLGKSAARFDRKKLDWLNGQHIRRMELEAFRDHCVLILNKKGFDTSGKAPDWLTQMAAICQEKLPTLNHIVEFTDFFFQPVAQYDEKAVKKQWMQEHALALMYSIRGAIEAVNPWTYEAFKQAIETLAEEQGETLGKFVHPMRLALTGKSVGPGLFELAALLGKETCLQRVDQGIRYIQETLLPTHTHATKGEPL